MPLYMAEFGYRPEVWAGLVQSPENREEKVRRMLEDAGAELHQIWYAFGEQDGFALIEAPDNVSAAGISIGITSSGAFRSFKTTVLMTQDETLKALEKAAAFHYEAPPIREPVHA